jgi:hypothetical protein
MNKNRTFSFLNLIALLFFLFIGFLLNSCEKENEPIDCNCTLVDTTDMDRLENYINWIVFNRESDILLYNGSEYDRSCCYDQVDARDGLLFCEGPNMTPRVFNLNKLLEIRPNSYGAGYNVEFYFSR